MKNYFHHELYGFIHKTSEAFQLLLSGKMKEFHQHMKRLHQEAVKRGEILE